jgi:hypothetical protein
VVEFIRVLFCLNPVPGRPKSVRETRPLFPCCCLRKTELAWLVKHIVAVMKHQ